MGSKDVIENYRHGSLLGAIKEGLDKMNISASNVKIEDLAPVDEFHIGGRAATAHLTEQLNVARGNTILDLGCGLGGASRYVAQTFSCRVEGIDLCQEYVETGRALNEWVHLGEKINLVQGSILDLPYPDNFFDGAYQIHVGMNIESKEKLFAEVYRILKPGASFGIFDIMATGEGDLQYPVPWAASSSISHLAAPEIYEASLEEAGFVISAIENKKEFALEFFKKMKARSQESGTPPLGLHTLMQASTPAKIQNMVKGVAENIVAPVEIVSKKAFTT